MKKGRAADRGLARRYRGELMEFYTSPWNEERGIVCHTPPRYLVVRG